MIKPTIGNEIRSKKPLRSTLWLSSLNTDIILYQDKPNASALETPMITSSELAIIIQGPVIKNNNGDNVTRAVIESIRKHFPKSQLILSTWENADLSELPTSTIDKIILSEDPLDQTPQGYAPININRQLISARAGLKETDKPYILKTRTDLIFKNDNILSLIGSSSDPKTELTFVDQPIVVCNLSTRAHHRQMKVPFWVCDFIYAGTNHDINQLFSIPDFPPEHHDYLSETERKNAGLPLSTRCRYCPESYITYSFFSKHVNIDFPHYMYQATETTALYEKLLVSNFIVFNHKQLGFQSGKYHLPFRTHGRNLTHNEWSAMHRKHLGTSLKYSGGYWDIFYRSAIRLRRAVGLGWPSTK